MSDISKKRYEKTGEMSADYFLSETLKEFKEKEKEGIRIERIAIAVKFSDETVEAGYDDGSKLEIIGLLDWAKLQAIESLND